MAPHRAFGLDRESLDVVIVDDAKPMQTILRSILLAEHIGRIRAFDGPEEALQSMLVEPPNLLITDWYMQPVDGLSLLRGLRRRRFGALAYVPAILVTAHPTRALVEAALGCGTHFVIAKPVAPATLLKRIDLVLTDAREFQLAPDGETVVLDGQASRIVEGRARWRTMNGDARRPTAEMPGIRLPQGPDAPTRPAAMPDRIESGPAEIVSRRGGFAAIQRRPAREAGQQAILDA